MNRGIPLTIYITAIIVMTSLDSPGQLLRITDDDRLQVSHNDLIFARLNDQVIIRDILIPDDNFDCLQPLGEPIEVDHQVVEQVGEMADYYYKDLKLSFTALSQLEFLLSGINFFIGSEIVFDSLNRIKVGTTLKSGLQFDESEKIYNLDEFIIYTNDYGPWISIKQESGIITEMIFYSSRD